MYAVVKTGGKQYRVSKGDRVKIEKIPGEVGTEVNFDQVLMIGGTEDVKVGTPVVSGATVTARIVKQDRSKKVTVFKFKRRVLLFSAQSPVLGPCPSPVAGWLRLSPHAW